MIHRAWLCDAPSCSVIDGNAVYIIELSKLIMNRPSEMMAKNIQRWRFSEASENGEGVIIVGVFSSLFRRAANNSTGGNENTPRDFSHGVSVCARGGT